MPVEALSESVQQKYRSGQCVDLYYPDGVTAQKQCLRTIQNTRYVQAFSNLSGGSSVLTIPPNNGVQDIIISIELPAQGGGVVYNGSALPRGWGYSLLKQVSFRYGGSSQYFLTGQQLLQNTLRKAPNGMSRDDLLALGGEAVAAAAAGAGDFSVARRAYIWLSLPHTVPTAEGKLPPIPSDLLTQQIQVTCELNPIQSIFSVAAAATPTLPSALSFAEFQVQQVMFEDQGESLARRADMRTHMLQYPIEFTQQEVLIPNLANAVANSSQTVTLTGFRSGECRNIQVWLTRDLDTSGVIKNPFAWYAPEDVTMTYAGEVFARFDKGSGALWNLVNGRQAPAANDVRVTDAGGGVCAITTPALDQWLELPFAQTFDALTAHSMYTYGKAITNGIINVNFRIPPSAPSGGAETYTLHVSYIYNGVLSFSQGTCEYLF